MAEITIDVKITVDGKVFEFNNFDEYGYSIPGGSNRDPFARVEDVADTIHRALWDGNDVPTHAVKTLMDNGVE